MSSAVVPSVAWMPGWLDACAAWRMYIPHLHTPGSIFIFNLALPLNEFADVSVCVVQRQSTPENRKALERIRQFGMKIVYDLDDNMWNIPAANPGKVEIEKLRRGFDLCMDLSDVLTVSTERLRSAVKTAYPGVGKPIEVVPNAIDLYWCRSRATVLPKDPDRIVVGWSGSGTHAGDVGYAWRAVTEVAKRRLPHVHFEFVGHPPPAPIAHLPNVRSLTYVPVAEFFSRYSSWSWDIVLGPLEDNRFNGSKSNIRMLEAAAVGAPCLVSPVGPYYEFCTKYDPELKYLMCGTDAEWERKLLELISDKKRRLYYADRMLRVAREHFDIDIVVRKWHDIFRAVAQ